ncbi:hypothetical protein GPROT1_00384 [Gammaproteobacteria bacterium]|nr:hypothetical protein GPROT1_00384 [Gammaproteobacteria bacterium]
MAVQTADEARSQRRRDNLAARAGANALWGAILWTLFVGVQHMGWLVRPWELPLAPDWVEMLFLFAPLVIVPLGLRAIALHSSMEPPEPLTWAGALCLPCAIPLLIAYSAQKSDMAMFFTLPWLFLCSLLALSALMRFKARGLRPLHELGFDVALAYIVIGAGWCSIARLGLRPLDFSEMIVQLTAVHFHFAGFALPIIAACLFGRAPGRVGAINVLGVIAGVPLLAMGISSKVQAVETVTALVLALICVSVAALTLGQCARGPARAGTRVLFAITGLSLLVSMGLAGAYAVGNLLEATWKLDIPTMATWHGTLNAFGFALCGLLALTRPDTK